MQYSVFSRNSDGGPPCGKLLAVPPVSAPSPHQLRYTAFPDYIRRICHMIRSTRLQTTATCRTNVFIERVHHSVQAVLPYGVCVGVFVYFCFVSCP